jgi:Fur family ferric uptake transcriptional regulator
MNDRRQDTAEQLVRAAGARVTQPRVGVLATLLDAPRALTHHEIVHQVRRALPIDRVTCLSRARMADREPARASHCR